MSAVFPGVFHRAGIYAVVHVLSGSRYVGQSRDLAVRLEHHLEMLQLGQHHNMRLQRMWDGDGRDAFEFVVIRTAPSELAGMPLQRWLLQHEGLYIKTFKGHGLAFNIVDAELVEPSLSTAPEPPTANQGITAALRELAPLIKDAEQKAAAARRAVHQHEVSLVSRLREAAKPRLFGFLSAFSAKETERIDTARGELTRSVEVGAGLKALVSAAESELAALLERRRQLHQSYSGNQARRTRRSFGSRL